MIPASARRLLGQPIWLQALLLLLLAGSVRLVADFVVHWQSVRSGDDLRFALLLGSRCLAVAAAGWAWLMAAVRRPDPPSAPGSQDMLKCGLQAAACIVLTAFLVTSLVQVVADLGSDRFAIRAVFRNVLLVATSLWAGRMALAPGVAAAAPLRAVSSRLVVVLVNVLVCLFVMEVAALWFSRLFPTRLLWDERSVEATIAGNRFAPGAPYCGFPMNSGGYYDEEFLRGGADDRVVALLADSFGVGIVPYRQNFATVAERRLAASAPVVGRVAVNNSLRLGLPRGLLPAGDYRIRLRRLIDGVWRPAAEYRCTLSYPKRPTIVSGAKDP